MKFDLNWSRKKPRPGSLGFLLVYKVSARLFETQGIKLAPFSTKIGLSRDTIVHILLGKSKNPGVYTVAKIASALGLSLDELVGNKTIATKESKDITVTNLELLDHVIVYITTAIKKHSSKLSMDLIFSSVKEIYKFSLNKEQLDKEFADWYISTHF